MEDSIAREGVLARCDQDRQAARDDIECANARRAAISIALEQERERLSTLEKESERRLEQMRQQVANAERAAAESAAAAASAQQQAYERLWREQSQAAAQADSGQESVPDTSSISANGPAEWQGGDDSLPFSPLNRIDPLPDSEIAEALPAAGQQPAP